MSEIKPVFYVDATTLRCRTMDDISDESVLYYRRGDKVHETDVALYPESAIEALQKENADLKEESQNYENASRIAQEWCVQVGLKNCELREANETQAKRIAELLKTNDEQDLLIKNLMSISGLLGSAAQAKRIEDLEAATEHLGLTPQQAADGLARHKAQVAEIELLRNRITGLESVVKDALNSIECFYSPPVPEFIPCGTMVLIRLHALAELHKAVHGQYAASKNGE